MPPDSENERRDASLTIELGRSVPSQDTVAVVAAWSRAIRAASVE